MNYVLKTFASYSLPFLLSLGFLVPVAAFADSTHSNGWTGSNNQTTSTGGSQDQNHQHGDHTTNGSHTDTDNDHDGDGHGSHNSHHNGQWRGASDPAYLYDSPDIIIAGDASTDGWTDNNNCQPSNPTVITI